VLQVIGVVLAWRIFGHEMLPLLFPLAAGLPLVGPIVAVGLQVLETAVATCDVLPQRGQMGTRCAEVFRAR
jgi:uncharacterized membrane protein